MRRTHAPTRASQITALCLALCGMAATLHAHAEAPMHTDDAGTLGQGSMKIEGVISRDDKTRGAELIFGAGVAPHLEAEVALAHGRDRSMSPSSRLNAVGWGLKWVPLQNDAGWSAGARLDVGQHARTRQRHPRPLYGARIRRHRAGQLPACQRTGTASQRGP
ncbi:MAG: hypothetical protein HEQ37_02550 [Acidovorax sp.]|nr:hypothetical protein [Acidovorax sp.]